MKAMKSSMKRALSALLMVLILAAGVVPAEIVSADTAVEKYTVKLTAKTKKMSEVLLPGDKQQLVVKSGGVKLSASQVTFVSSKKKVVSVSKKGVLTAKKAGKSVITVTYQQANAITRAKITVTVLSVQTTLTTDGAKTIKNFLLGGFLPVGKVLYVWGGGWTDASRKGISSTMVKWYWNNDSTYDYHKYNDLTVANRVKGFDCSGYVGWVTYQAMHQTSNEVYGYTVVSGYVGSTYKARGWGSVVTQSKLAKKKYVLKPGDIGFNGNHVFIIIGQCKDKSVVIEHSTPQAGVQIAGTATPDGNYNSQAVALARQYMAKFAKSPQYTYQFCSGHMIPQYEYFRWNRQTLADPEGYMKMSADEILSDLFATYQRTPS